MALATLPLPVWAASPERAAIIAQHYIGTRYLFGGATPAGFDCSGLVQFAFRQAGIAVPRTVLRLRAHTSPVNPGKWRKGDLLFFALPSRTHVGIYVGSGVFIHAPSRGKRVSYAHLHSTYWLAHYTGAGRVTSLP